MLHALLSAIVPGVGQMVAGARRRGTVMLAVVFILAVAAVVIALQGVDEVLSWLVRPSVLLALLGVNVALLAFRLFAVVDAYRSGGRRTRASMSRPSPAPPVEGEPAYPEHRRWRSAAAGIALTLLLVLTIAPHGVAGYYTYLSYDALVTVFVSDTETTASTRPVSSTTTSVAVIVPTSTTGRPSTSITTTTTVAPADEEPQLDWGEDRRLTILLIGSDAGYGRTGSRADSIMVVTLDLDSGRVALFGIPRNTGSVPLSETAAEALGTRTYVNLISSLYWEAQDHPELAPEGGDPGAVVLRDTVGALLGIPIHHYAVVDMGGFAELVDAFGGVTVNVTDPVRVRISPPTADGDWKVYDIQPGKQHLDGLEALAFARSRTGSSDYVRMGRQRCVLSALLYQNGMAEMALKFPSVVKVVRENLRTDIPIDTLSDLVKVRSSLKTDEMITVGFTPPDYLQGRNALGYNILDLESVQEMVRKIIEHPEEVLSAQDSGSDVDESDCWKID